MMTGMKNPVRGIGYDAGVIYDHDFDSRPHWSPTQTRDDLRVIRQELGCDSVLVMATDIDRLIDTARLAREEGLNVWVQPRLFDADRDVISEYVGKVAERAEALRMSHGEIYLNIGCELSLSARGFTPGKTFSARGSLLPLFSVFLPLINVRLRAYLRQLVHTVRTRFNGPISYGAGEWERPDWSLFDVVGLDAYRDATNAWRFAPAIRNLVAKHHRQGRPVYIFEFGTCSYVGAAENASQASGILKEGPAGLRVPRSATRDEQVQARYIEEMLEIFTEAAVDGTFVWGFSEPQLIRSMQPGQDLDLASYGVVAPAPDGSWTPKAAFHTVARKYRDSE